MPVSLAAALAAVAWLLLGRAASRVQGPAAAALLAAAGAARLVAGVGACFLVLEWALVLAGAHSAFARSVLQAQRWAEWSRGHLEVWFGDAPLLLAWLALAIGMACFGPGAVAAWVPRLRRVGAALRLTGTVVTLAGCIGLFGTGASNTLQRVHAQVLAAARAQAGFYAEAQLAVERAVVRAAAQEVMERAEHCDGIHGDAACDFRSPWQDLQRRYRSERDMAARRGLTPPMGAALDRVGEALAPAAAGRYVFEMNPRTAAVHRRPAAGGAPGVPVASGWNEADLGALASVAARREPEGAQAEILDLAVGVALAKGGERLQASAADTALGAAVEALVHPLLAEPVKAALGEIGRAVFDRVLGWDTPAAALAWARGEARRAVGEVTGLTDAARRARGAMLATARDLWHAAAERDRAAAAELARLAGDATLSRFADPGVTRAAAGALGRVAAAAQALVPGGGEAADVLAAVRAAKQEATPMGRLQGLAEVERQTVGTTSLRDAAEAAAAPLLAAEAGSRWGKLRQDMGRRIMAGGDRDGAEKLLVWLAVRGQAAREAVLAGGDPDWEALFARTIGETHTLEREWLRTLSADTGGAEQTVGRPDSVHEWGRRAGLSDVAIIEGAAYADAMARRRSPVPERVGVALRRRPGDATDGGGAAGTSAPERPSPHVGQYRRTRR